MHIQVTLCTHLILFTMRIQERNSPAPYISGITDSLPFALLQKLVVHIDLDVDHSHPRAVQSNLCAVHCHLGSPHIHLMLSSAILM